MQPTPLFEKYNPTLLNVGKEAVRGDYTGRFIFVVEYDKNEDYEDLFCFEAGFEVAGGMNDLHCAATEQLLEYLFSDYADNLGANSAESFHEFTLPKGMKPKKAAEMIKQRLLDAGAFAYND